MLRSLKAFDYYHVNLKVNKWLKTIWAPTYSRKKKRGSRVEQVRQLGIALASA